MKIKKTLASVVLLTTIGLSRCGYQMPQKDVDKVAEQPVKEWVQTSDNYMNVYQLLKEGNYNGAQAVLKQYLRERVREGVKYKGTVGRKGKVSKIAAGRIGRTIDEELNKLQKYLKE